VIFFCSKIISFNGRPHKMVGTSILLQNSHSLSLTIMFLFLFYRDACPQVPTIPPTHGMVGRK
jgi:hypothetical protein